MEIDPSHTIENTPMEEFISSICGGNPTRVNLIRAVLNLILTNRLDFQVGIYIHGRGGTGKSTLVNILQFLLGVASISMGLKQLNSNFGLANLVNKTLLVVNDISHYKGPELAIFKLLIGGDSVSGDRKFKTIIRFTPSVFVVITSNTIWEITNPTSGYSRR